MSATRRLNKTMITKH